MIPFDTLYSQLVTLVKATWPAVVVAGDANIWETDHVAEIPFDTLSTEHLPYAVIVFPAPEPVTMGEANRCYLLRCEFWYVAEVSKGSSALWQQAEAMAAALWAEGRTPTTVTAGTVWSDPMPQPLWGTRIPINELLREKRGDILAAGAVATVLVGESA